MGYLSIDPAGRIKLCPLHPAELGNLESEEIDLIVDRYDTLKTDMHKLSDACSRCVDWELCMGGCPAITDRNGYYGMNAYADIWNLHMEKKLNGS